MSRYLNGTTVPLSVGVFLATDNYDYDPEAISATALLKPIRQAVLARRVPEEEQMIDITSLFKARMGQAIHDAIEAAWKKDPHDAMRKLGYDESFIERVVVNPDPDSLTGDEVPVYLEQREKREIDGYTISGKFDYCIDGELEDFKSTSVFSYQSGSKDRDYQIQGSVYKWLNPRKITADTIAIRFLLTDWMQGRAGSPNYPSTPIPSRHIPLLSEEETEQYIRGRLEEFHRHRDAPEEELPLCNDEELWRSATKYKYYANPEKTGRATKVFDNALEAHKYAAEKNKGIVVEAPGEVSACKFCPAFPVCSQKDQLMANGELKLY